MNANPFDAYRLPPAVAEGVWIDLPNTPARFKVALPSEFNEGYQAALMRLMTETADLDAEGFEFDPMQMAANQRSAFLSACVLEAEGLPDGMDPAAFFAAYPIAFRIVFEQAQSKAQDTDKALGEALGNSALTRAGRLAGRTARMTTAPSKKAASSPKEAAVLN